MHSTSFSNEQTGSGLARSINTHNASSFVQSQKPIEGVLPQFEKLHAALTANPPFSPHAAQTLLSPFQPSFDIALLSHKDQTLTLATAGSGVIFLKRAGKIVELVGDGHAAQGPPQRGDEYILTTNEFLDLIGGLEGLQYYFLHYTSAEVVEMMKTYEEQTVACGFLAIQYGSKHEDAISQTIPPTPLAQPEDSTEPLGADDSVRADSSASPVRSEGKKSIPQIMKIVASSVAARVKNIQIPFIPKLFSSGRLRLAVLILIPTVFLIYLAYTNLGGRTPQSNTKADYLQSIQTQVEQKLQDADTEAFVNIAGVEATLNAAHNILKEIPEKEQKKYANEIAQLATQIEAKRKQVMRISDVVPQEYFDLHLISADASATDVDFDGTNFYLLDSGQGKVYVVDTTQRSHTILSSDKYKGATQVTTTGRYAYVLTASDGVYLAEEDRSTQVIKPDSRWGTITDMKAYTGNIYLLDARAKDIFKYPGVDEIIFGDKGPYLVPELQGNLLGTDTFSIDGSIYTTSAESVSKFTTGRKADFKLIVPHREVSISALYADPDLTQMYLSDSANKALYAVSKDGVFDKQWVVEQPVIGLGVSGLEQKIFFVTARYIFEIGDKVPQEEEE